MARMLKHAVPARTAVACGSYDLNKEMQRLRIFGLYSHPGNGQAPWKWAGWKCSLGFGFGRSLKPFRVGEDFQAPEHGAPAVPGLTLRLTADV